jgi:hypothetical protein
MYWRPQQFLPPGLSRGAEFVAFKDLKQDKYLVGLLAESDDSELDFFTLDHESVCRDRKLILAGTAVRGQGHDFAATVCEMDFLHYVLLNVIRHLDSNEEKCGYSLLAVRVDTRRLDEQLEEFTKAESDSMDNLERMKSIAAGPPGTSRSIEGRGILGTLLAFSYMNEERRAENSLTSPFLQELQSVHTVREAASRLLQFLKDQANWIEDEIYRILTQRNVTVLERARLDQVLKERRLSTTEEFEPTDLVRLLTATHLLTVELGPAREGGTYHVTATLVECSSARKLWTEDRDRFVPVPGSLVTASGAFLFNTGPLAKLYTSAEATKVKLVHIDRHDPASMLRYREVFGGDTRELRGAAASFGYITGDADVPPPLVPKYLAWRIAYATMPIACPVTAAHGSVGTIWVGDNKTVKPDVKLTVYRNASKTTPSAGHSIQRPLATTASVTKRTQNAAEIVLSAPGVNYVWPDECTLVEGDFVVSVRGQTPLIAAVGIDFLGLDQNLAQALQIGNVLQRNRIDGERRDRMKAISDEVKQQLLDAGIAFIEAEGPDPATRMQDARRRGATHIVRGSCSFTKKRSEYELIMKLQRIDKEGVHAEVKVTVK